MKGILSVVPERVKIHGRLPNDIEVEQLQIDEGRLPLLSMLSPLLIVVLYHSLNFIKLPLENDTVTRCGVLSLADLPVIPPSRQTFPPTLHHDLLHFLLQVLSDTPNAQISDLLLRIDAHFKMVVAKLQTRRVLLD